MLRRAVPLTVFCIFFLPFYCLTDGYSADDLTLLNTGDKGAQTAGQNPIVLDQDKELRDIHGPVPLSEPIPWWYLLGGAIVLFFLVTAIVWFLRTRTQPAPPNVPPWEKALHDLAGADPLLNPEQGRLYMDRVCQILRYYIESQFTIQSTKQTTQEFLHSLKDISSGSPLTIYRSELQTCMEQADMAKFAHLSPSIANLHLIKDATTTFIKRTGQTQQIEGQI